MVVCSLGSKEQQYFKTTAEKNLLLQFGLMYSALHEMLTWVQLPFHKGAEEHYLASVAAHKRLCRKKVDEQVGKGQASTICRQQKGLTVVTQSYTLPPTYQKGCFCLSCGSLPCADTKMIGVIFAQDAAVGNGTDGTEYNHNHHHKENIK